MRPVLSSQDLGWGQFYIYVSSLEAKETGGENTNNPWLEGYPIVTVSASIGPENTVQMSLLVLE